MYMISGKNNTLMNITGIETFFFTLYARQVPFGTILVRRKSLAC